MTDGEEELLFISTCSPSPPADSNPTCAISCTAADILPPTTTPTLLCTPSLPSIGDTIIPDPPTTSNPPIPSTPNATAAGPSRKRKRGDSTDAVMEMALQQLAKHKAEKNLNSAAMANTLLN